MATPTPQRRAQMQRRAASSRRPATTPRRTPGRRQPQRSGAQKLLGALTGALPIGGGAKTAKGRGKPSKGLLVLGAGAGIAALRNRDRLAAKLPGGSRPRGATVEPAVPVSQPAPVAHGDGAPAS